MDIKDCEGYKTLLAAVMRDIETRSRGEKDCMEKLHWVEKRAELYAEKTGVGADKILDAWEKGRSYWYMNYYQECNQPDPGREKVYVFENQDELMKAIGPIVLFRCPRCGGTSKNPYECDSGNLMDNGNVCDWKVWGLFGDLGKGAYIFLKDKARGETIFMPCSWEPSKP